MRNYFRRAPLVFLIASSAGCVAPQDTGPAKLEIAKRVSRAAVAGERSLNASATLKGDSVKFVYTISNEGTGMARRVMLTDSLPDGMKTVPDDSGRVEMALGDLVAGARVTVEVPVRFSKCGTFVSKGVVTSGTLVAESEEEPLFVAEPKLELKFMAPVSGPGIRSYGWRVTNTGDAEAANTVVIGALPPGAEIVETSENAAVGESSVRWTPGTLAPGGSADVFVKVRGAAGIPSADARVFAYARCVGASSARATPPSSEE